MDTLTKEQIEAYKEANFGDHNAIADIVVEKLSPLIIEVIREREAAKELEKIKGISHYQECRDLRDKVRAYAHTVQAFMLSVRTLYMRDDVKNDDWLKSFIGTCAELEAATQKVLNA